MPARDFICAFAATRSNCGGTALCQRSYHMPDVPQLCSAFRQDPFQLFDTERSSHDLPINLVVKQLAAATNLSPITIAGDYASLALGPGRISFSDYLKLRLFDKSYYGDNDRRDVVGRRRNLSLVKAANYRIDWMGLFANKIALNSYLNAYGFETIPTVAIYSAGLSSSSSRVLASVDALRAFLRNADNYPLFCKPVEGYQSLGSISLKCFQPNENLLETFDGRALAVDRFIAEVSSHYKEGYLFQRRLVPHAEIRRLCGDRLATIRIVTILADSEPAVFRACWKIPAGVNAADNYWRQNNLLASIDLATWRVTQVISGTGLELRHHTHHPDTGEQLIGIEVPNGAAAAQLALSGSRLMRDMPLIGWDVASLDAGPIIVEANEKPDFFLNQLADARGILDREFLEFLKSQERKAAARTRAIKRESRQL